MCDTVASQLVGNEAKWFPSLALQQSAKESLRSTPIPTGLNENVDHVPVLIHRPPEILALTVDRDEYLVQIPGVSAATLATFQSPGVLVSELPAPLPDRFV